MMCVDVFSCFVSIVHSWLCVAWGVCFSCVRSALCVCVNSGVCVWILCVLVYVCIGV